MPKNTNYVLIYSASESLWNTREDILRDVLVVTLHTIEVNGGQYSSFEFCNRKCHKGLEGHEDE